MLLLEAGVKAEHVLKTINWEVEKVCAMLVSHRHGDHAKYILQLSKYFPIYSNYNVAEFYEQVKPLEAKRRYRIGAFTIIPLQVPHGECLNYAYIIDNVDIGRCVFCTDAESFPYKIANVNHIIIECNNVEDVILDNLMHNKEIRSQAEAHMELSETIKAVERLRSPALQNVILIHLSKDNADRDIITRRFKDELGIDVKIATKGKEFELNKYDF